MWEYQCRLDENEGLRGNGVVDGDTLHLIVDLGFDVLRKVTLRIDGIDTAEIHFVSHDSEEYEIGMEQTEFVDDWVQEVQESHDGEFPFIVRSRTWSGKYGRSIGDVQRKDNGEWITDALIEEWPEVEV